MIFSHLSACESSLILSLNALAKEKQAQGDTVYNLSVGEPILPPAPEILAAANRAMQEGKTLYPPPSGIPELRTAASVWMNERYGTSFSSKNTLVTAGGKSAIAFLFQAVLNPLDEVILFTPYWPSYIDLLHLFGAKPVLVETEEADGWRPNTEKVRAAITPKTKIIIVNNGANPTGAVFPQEDLKELLEIAEKNNLLLLSDEVYSELTYDTPYLSYASIAPMHPKVVIIESCSKSFGMTGWRVGFAFAQEEIVGRMVGVQGSMAGSPPTVSQYAAKGALENRARISPWIRGELDLRRRAFARVFHEAFASDVALPASALYYFISLQAFGLTTTDDVLFCRDMFERAGVVMVPGTAFGRNGYVRCSFGGRQDETKNGIMAVSRAMPFYGS